MPSTYRMSDLLPSQIAAYFKPMLAAGFTVGEAMALLYHAKYIAQFTEDSFATTAANFISLRDKVLRDCKAN